MGGSTRRCKINCDDGSWKLAVGLGVLLGVSFVVVLVVSCTLGGDRSMDRKNDVKAQESNIATFSCICISWFGSSLEVNKGAMGRPFTPTVLHTETNSEVTLGSHAQSISLLVYVTT